VLLLAQAAHAGDLGEGLINQSNSMLLKNNDNKYTHWNGIGKIFRDSEPQCTASLLDTRDEDNKALGPAYLLTAGHCVSPGLGYPVAEMPFEASVIFNFFNDTSDEHKSYKLHKANWASMSGTDIAILELDTHLSTLLEDGVTPLKLAYSNSKIVRDVLIVGAPQNLPESGLRLAACLQESTEATLVENWWTFPNTLKNRCKDIRSGSSGSPVLDRETGSIVGVLFTSTFGSTPDESCFVNSPCEVKNGKAGWSPETQYSHAIDYLPGCFVKGIFSTTSSSCTLEPSFKLELTDYLPLRYTTAPSIENQKTPTWNLVFSMDTPYYRFKTVRDARECSSAHYYSHVISTTDALIDTPTGREAGMYFLCVLGVESAEQTPTAGLLRNAWISPAQLVEAEPARMAEPTITLGADWNYNVTWRNSLPLYFNNFYYVGPTDKTNCNDIKRENYTYVYGNNAVTFTAEQLPLTLCSYNNSLDSRSSAVRTDLLTLP
jgi:hypothetical protein